MKIKSDKNISNIRVINENDNIILSINLDTTIDSVKSLSNEPIHYSFLIDISSHNIDSNIKKEKIKIILNSFIEDTVPLFKEDDLISVLVYNQEMYNLFHGVTKKDKNYMIERTNLLLEKVNFDDKYNNIAFALESVRNKVLLPKNYNKKKLILITDTKPTFGKNEFGKYLCTEEDVLNEAKEIAEQNIAMDCICIGSVNNMENGDYDFAYKLVQPTNGRAYTIDHPELIKIHLSDSIKDSHNSSRYNGKLTLLFNKGVSVSDYFSVAPENKYFGNMKIEEPNEDIGYNHCVIELPELKDDTIYNYMMKVNVPTIITDEEKSNPNYKGFKTRPIIKLELKYDAIEDGKLKTFNIDQLITVNVTEDIILSQQGIIGDINRNFKLATIKKLEREFIRANREGDMKTLYDTGNAMYKNYQELGRYDEANLVKGFFGRAIKGESLNSNDINLMVKTSTTARVIEDTQRDSSIFDSLITNM